MLRSYKILLSLVLFTITFTQEPIKYQDLPVIGNNELITFSGEQVDFSEFYSDGPVLLSFWFLGCGPCVAEMKYLSKFNEKYKETGFKVISVNTDPKKKGKIKSFVKKKKYSFDMVFDVNGKSGLLKKFGSNSCPFTVLINSDGTIYSKHLGYERGDEIKLEKEINNLINYNHSLDLKEIDINEDKVIENIIIYDQKEIDIKKEQGLDKKQD